MAIEGLALTLKLNGDSGLFTVEGTIQSLRIAPGIANLVEDIRKAALFTGMAAGLAEQAGMLANAASLALYDGEDVEHVALLINGRLAIGTFEWLQDLRVGDEVKLVVAKIDEGPLFVHGILRKSDQLLWTPLSVNHTRRGWVLHSFKLGTLILGLTLLMFGSFFLFDKDMRPNEQELIWLIVFLIFLMTFIMFMSAKGVMHLGEQAEDIFHALGVPKFERFRIKPYSIVNLHFHDDPDSLKKRYIFKFSDALAAHKKKFNLP
jgi:hypothetical protein